MTLLVLSVPPGDPLGPVDQDADKVRDEACHVVHADPASCTVKPTPTPTPDSGGGTDLSFLALLLWVALAAAVVLLLVRLLGSRFGFAKQRARAEGDTQVDDVVEDRVVVVDRSREPSDWRAEAEAHRRSGRYRDAVRCRYRGLIGDLARRGLIDEIPGRTTGEHRAQMHDVRPHAAIPFDEAADLFDDAWYGHADVDERDDDRFMVLTGDVIAATSARPVEARR